MYSKDNGTTYQASNVFSGLGAGTYQIMVKDDNDCTSTATSVTITAPAVLSTTASGSFPVICSGDNLTLSTITTGGTPNYTYSWTGPNGFTSTSQDPLISNITTAATGNYVVTATDANGCQATSSVSITVNPLPVMTSSDEATICSGEAVSIPLTATIAGSTFRWSAENNPNVTGEKTTIQTSSTLSNALTNTTTVLQTVTFTVTPSAPASGGSCEGPSQTVTVTVYPKPTMTSASTKTICSGEPVDLVLASSVASDYTWIATANSSVDGQSTSQQTSGTINDVLVNTTNTVRTVRYTVTPTSTDGSCVGNSQTVTITVNPKPAMTSANAKTICSGTTVGLSFTSTVSGSSYSWVATENSDVSGENTSAQTSNTLSDVLVNNSTVPQTVTYTVTPSANGCSGDAQTVTITVDPVSNGGTITAFNAMICFGSTTGTLSLSGYTGTILRWERRLNEGSWSNISNTTASHSETPSSAGSWEYRVLVKSGICSEAYSDVISIQVNPRPTSVISGNAILCQGGSATLTIQLTGTGPWNLTYSNGTTSTNITGVATSPYSLTVSPASSATYTITALSDALCSANSSDRTGSAVVTVASPTTAGVISASPTVICYGETVTISSPTNGAGSGSISYLWEGSPDGSTNWTSLGGTTTTPTNSFTLTTTTWIRRTTIATFGTAPNTVECPSAPTTPVKVSVHPDLEAGGIVASNQTLCEGETPAQLVSETAGSGGTYRWERSIDNVNWTIIAGSNSANYTPGPLSQTTYFRRVVYSTIDGVTCLEATNTVTISVNPLPTIPAINASKTEICEGETVTLSASPGSVSGYTYTLYYDPDGSGTYEPYPASTANGTGLFPITPNVGKYNYKIMVSNGSCDVYTEAIEVRTYDVPEISATKNIISSCTTNDDGYILVTYTLDQGNFDPGEQVIEFSFDGSPWGPSPYIGDLEAGTYQVAVRNTGLCISETEVTISAVLVETVDKTICQFDMEADHMLSATALCYLKAGNDMNYNAIPHPDSTYYVTRDTIKYNGKIRTDDYIQGPLVRYVTLTFTVEEDGLYDITAVRGNSNPPSRIALYRYPFIPDHPEINLLAMDNTYGADGNMGWINDAALLSNVNYVAVASYYDENVPKKPRDNINLHLDNNHGSKMVPTEPVPPKWYVEDPATGTYTYLGSGYTFDPFTTPGSGIENADVPGRYVFYAGCEIDECLQPAILTINPIPYPEATGPEVNCSDVSSDILLRSYTITGREIPADSITYSWTSEVFSGNAADVTGYTSCSSGCPPLIADPVQNTGYDPVVIRYTIYAKVEDCEAYEPITFDLTVNPLPEFSATPMDQTICPSSAIGEISVVTSNTINNLSYYWERDELGYLPATGNPQPIAANGTVAASTFAINGILHSTDPQNAHTTTFTIEAQVNNFTCASQEVTVTVQDLAAPVIVCPPGDVFDCADAIPNPATDHQSFVEQSGEASDDCTAPEDLIFSHSDVWDGTACDSTLTRTYTVTDLAGRKSTCTQVFSVIDDVAPTFIDDPNPVVEYCVVDIRMASYDEEPEPDADIVASFDPQYEPPVDVLKDRPDYYVLTDADKNELYLNPIEYFDDNCSNIILYWSLYDSAGNPVEDYITGTALENRTSSLFDHVIKLDGAELSDVDYTLVYWLVDGCGRRSDPDDDKTVLITIKPRPYINKLTTN